MLRLSTFAVLYLSALPAHAHWGHVGELAGHGHLIGLGALAGAAALGAILRKPKERKDTEENEEPCEGETA